MRYVDKLATVIDWLAGKLGGLGGTSFPSTVFNCVIPSVTLVEVVKATALLTRFPRTLVPKGITLPTTPAAAADAQDKLPDPFVVNRYPDVPPEICKLLIFPKLILAVLEKSTIPVVLLMVNPVKEPTLVILGCALV